ncbi:MAG: sec-independent protein translocase protein TatC [Candidatus Azotimanducaceae bacterium]|jgi:sec-independent protein translocase protein TatC|tara:strand:+ start:4137 stop:5066 length:930 start_codon:yes stop_codon:yes gene_type:complete
MSQTEDIKDGMDDSSAPLIEHLTELRSRLIRAVAAFVVAMLICFVFAGYLLDFLLLPIEKTMRELGNASPVMQYTAPQEYFFTLLKIAMVGGLALGFPIIGTQLWRFVAPGLYRNEKSAFLPFLIASPVLFIVGAMFAHLIVTPLAMRFFLGFQDIPSLFSGFVDQIAVNSGDVAAVPEGTKTGIDIVFLGKVNETLDITLKLIVAFGLCFQLPVLLTLMGKSGLIDAGGLRRVRKYAVVGILSLAAVVTPPDVITQVILFVAVYGLYEISILLVARVDRDREAKLREDGFYEDDEEAYDDVDDEDDAK